MEEVVEYFSETWRLFTENLVTLLLMGLLHLVLCFVSFVLLWPVVTAGFCQSLLLLIREGREPEIKDLFSRFNLLFPLLALYIIAVIVIVVGFSLLLIPGVIMSLALTYFGLYIIPLMTDRKMKLMDAIKASYQLALEKPLTPHLLAVAVYILFNTIGGFTLIGTVLTTPFTLLFVMLVYDEKVEESELVDTSDLEDDFYVADGATPPPLSGQ